MINTEHVTAQVNAISLAVRTFPGVDPEVAASAARLDAAASVWAAAGGEIDGSLDTLVAVNDLHGQILAAYGDDDLPVGLAAAFKASGDLVDLAEQAGFVVNDPEPALPRM